MGVYKLNMAALDEARARQDILTKPQGALGRLEDIACWFAARQGKAIPEPLKPHICVFAGDHGVVDEGVSAFPSVVTGEMVKNFINGGAAINVLARQCNAGLSVVDAGVCSDVSGEGGIIHARVRAGAGNIVQGPAMTAEECSRAVDVGRAQARAAVENGANLLIAGDMGIGNTTPSACLICAFTGGDAEDVAGYGTGVDAAGRTRKVAVVQQAIQRAGEVRGMAALCELGGVEIAAMSGFYLEAATSGVPAVVDGFIAAAAALAAWSMEPGVTDWMLASHVSQEKGHRIALEALGLEPLIDFNMRLGEGTGAALVVPLLQSAIALHREMATFESAGVTGAC